MEQQFITSRSKDRTSANLPEISSVEYNLDDDWSFFLKVLDPQEINDKKYFVPGGFHGLDDDEIKYGRQLMSRNASQLECMATDGLDTSLNKMVADLDKIKRKLLEPEKKKIIERIAKLSKLKLKQRELNDRLVGYFGQKEALTDGITGLSNDDKSTLNDASIGEIFSSLNILKSKTDLNSVAWISPERKKFLNDLRPFADVLLGRGQKLFKNIEKEWKQYEQANEDIRNQVGKVMKAEREYYDAYCKLTSQKENDPCQNFQL